MAVALDGQQRAKQTSALGYRLNHEQGHTCCIRVN